MRTQNVLRQSKKLPEAFTQKSTNSSNIPPSVWQIVPCCKKKNRSGAPNACEQAPGNVRPAISFPFSRETKNREYEREKQTKSYDIPTYTVASGFPGMFSDPVFFFPYGLPSLQSNDRIAAATSSSSRPTTDHTERVTKKPSNTTARTRTKKPSKERKNDTEKFHTSSSK